MADLVAEAFAGDELVGDLDGFANLFGNGEVFGRQYYPNGADSRPELGGVRRLPELGS
jgi:hypothetical protein